VPEPFQQAVVAADFDRDGHVDVASTGAYFGPRSPGAKLTVAHGDGAGTLTRLDTIWGLAEFPQVLAVADVDGNGRSDLLVSLSASGPISFPPPATYAVLLQPATCESQGDCDDGVFCNGVESCGDGSCRPGTPPSCDDGEVCTEDLCRDSCEHVPVFPDNDLDIHVEARCGGDDCRDDDPTVWSAPFEVAGLTASGIRLDWQGQAQSCGPETRYDLVSGALTAGSAPDFASAACLSSTTAIQHDDTRPAPAAGSAYWYLVRSRNSCGTATYGSSSGDHSIPPCP
jgi:hypothetical protein